MPASNLKFQYQCSLIARLRELAGTVTAGYINQKEFFIATLQNMSESLMDLQREMLRETREGFMAKLDHGPVTREMVVDFKAQLDKLVSGRDFYAIGAAIAGSNDLVRARLSALQPLSIVEEEKKKLRDRDQGADRLVTEAYRRLKFDALERKLALIVNDHAINKTLTKARENVSEYCCLYRVPLREDDTLTPFSVSRIDAVAGACFRLMSRIRDIMANK